MRERRRTSTSNFGVGARESHDAVGLLRPLPPARALRPTTTVLAPTPVAEPFVCGDARPMDAVADGSVALVVTSPPYFAGKQYEEELERDGVPVARTSSTSSCSPTCSPSACACSSRAGGSRSTSPTSAASRTAACRPT